MKKHDVRRWRPARSALRAGLPGALLLIAGIASVAGLAGCGDEEREAAADAPQDAAARAESEAVPAARTAPDPTALEGDRPHLHRGTVTATARGLRFVSCGGQAPLHLEDGTGRDLARFLGPRAESEPMAYVELMGVVAPLPTDNALPGVKGVLDARELLFASREQAGHGCETDLAGIEVVARGDEPSWWVEVRREGVTYRSPDFPAGLVFSSLEAVQDEDARVYNAHRRPGAEEPDALVLTVTMKPCRDSMAGDHFAWTARLEIAGETASGCARPGHPEAGVGGR